MSVKPLNRKRRSINLRETEDAAAESLRGTKGARRNSGFIAADSKDDFIAILAHELRNPLNAISGWAQMLSIDGVDPKRVKHAAEIIAASAELQRDLIDDLLDIAGINTGKLNLEMQSVSLRDLLLDMVDRTRPLAEVKGIKLVSEIPRSKSMMICGDRKRLEQIVGNLLSNALKFTDIGGTISVKLKTRDGDGVFTIEDDGDGISPEALPGIFDMFRQSDGVQNERKLAGLGLGLTLVKQFVGMHGGKVSASSDGKGNGSKFSVSLPLI